VSGGNIWKRLLGIIIEAKRFVHSHSDSSLLTLSQLANHNGIIIISILWALTDTGKPLDFRPKWSLTILVLYMSFACNERLIELALNARLGFVVFLTRALFTFIDLVKTLCGESCECSIAIL